MKNLWRRRLDCKDLTCTWGAFGRTRKLFLFQPSPLTIFLPFRQTGQNCNFDTTEGFTRIMAASGIEIQGRTFATPTSFTFFTKTPHRIALVFGRNGSGKSTIGDGFMRLTNPETVPDLAADFLSSSSRPRAVPPQASPLCLVFNETFVEKNIKIRQDGLKSMILLGDAVGTQEALEAAEVTLNDLEELQSSVSDAYSDALGSRDSAQEQLIALLKNTWAETDRVIRSLRSKTKVTVDTIDRFLGLGLPTVPREDIQHELSEVLTTLKESRQGEPIIATPPVLDSRLDAKAFDSEILARCLPVPTGEGIARRVAEVLETHGDLAKRAKGILSSENLGYCPFCLQDLPGEHSQIVLAAFGEAVDKPAQAFIELLDQRKIANPNLELDAKIAGLDGVLAERLKALSRDLETAVSEWNSEIERKKDALYSPLEASFDHVAEILRKLETVLTDIEDKRRDWNTKLEQTETLQTRAVTLNRHLARIDTNGLLEIYTDTQKKLNRAKENLDSHNNRVLEAKDRVSEIAGALRNESYAADIINRGCASIFADNSRLRLQVDPTQDGRYHVTSRGAHVPPSRLSVGERNVLAICYYFALVQHQIETSPSSKSLFLVLDDPISSVDIDNRVGLLSYLEHKLSTLMQSDKGSRTLFLTHDVGIYHDLGKTSKAVLERIDPPRDGEWKTASWILQPTTKEGRFHSELVRNEAAIGQPLHEYRDLLQYVYEFAKGDASYLQSSLNASGVGNALRRVFEAFTVFIYNQSSIQSRFIEQIYSRLYPESDLTPIRQALQTVLHGGSHNKDRTMMLAEFGSGGAVSPDEQVVVVRKILGLMYALQPIHMAVHLSESAALDLEAWEMFHLRNVGLPVPVSCN